MLATAFLLLCGCNWLGFRLKSVPEGIDLGKEDRAKSNELSRDTMEILYRENLHELYSRDQEAAFENLVGNILKDPNKQDDPRRLYAAAEFANVLAERGAPPWNRRPTIRPRGHKPGPEDTQSLKIERFLSHHQDVLTYYGMASYLSYAYLSVASKRLQTEAFNPQFRQGCELYNYSLEQTLRFTLDSMPFNPRLFYRLDDPSGITQVQFQLVGFDWKEEDIHDLLPAEDYRSNEIGPTSRWKGLGVPLIGIRYAGQTVEDTLYLPVTAFPITALYIPHEDFDLEATETRDMIHLVNPWSQEGLTVGDTEIPIEADLSTPLNYMLKNTGFDNKSWEGFVVGKEELKGSVFLIQPHRRGRIPVVLCHGLLSSPEPWETLVNGLMSDPWIRQHYEFWFMEYPTGLGILVNAWDLRESLWNLRRTLDPDETDPGLDRIVLIGHSMGGLISTVLSHDSGQAFWDMAWDVPVEQLDLTPEEREGLQSFLCFERLPFIERVIFLGTPHQGAPLASRPIGWLGTKLVDLPKSGRALLKSIGNRNLQHARVPLDEDSFTSVWQLRQGSPMMQAMNRLEHPAKVHFHNVVGNISEASKEGTDGTVPIASASIDWAETEIEVPARHTEIQRHPLTIQEIHRLLVEHVQGDTEKVPVGLSRERQRTRCRCSMTIETARRRIVLEKNIRFQ